MATDFIRRQVDRLLLEAAEAIGRADWDAVRQHAASMLRLEPENADAVALLAAAGRGPSTLIDTAPADLDVNVAQAPPPAAPQSFANGRYQVKRFLGEGGKKRVYLAHDTLLARDVAFALIKTDGLDAEGRERITREGQAMGRLGTHPHIVAVFDAGVEGGEPGNGRTGEPASGSAGILPAGAGQGGAPYLVTELMAGGDIEALLQKAEGHRLPIADAINLALQVCQGLEFAHGKGLIHRDLKPGNIWLTGPVSGFEFKVSSGAADPKPETRNLELTAKIGDFGLAVSLDRSRLTTAGMMVGTVAYMPPEQAMGGDVSPRSDLYSLGAMLYEMVCGRPPFVGEESVAIITQHLNTPPITPSWHRPDIPAGLEALILRLLEKDASKRPGSAGEVRRALEGVSSSEFRVSSASDPDSKLETRNTELSDNPLYRRTFVGRETELRQLQSTFDGAVSGQGALAMVVGEPGIGKTALCEQLATYAAVRGGKALVGHCYEEGSHSLPYLPFVEAVRSYVLAATPEKLRAELGSGATDVARIVSEVRDKVHVEPRAASDPEDDRWRLYQSLTGFLRNASGVQPLVIVLEDLHWADRGTLDFLLHLSRNLQGTRLLIVGTYRDVEVDRAHPLSGTLAEVRRSGNFARIPLRGLTPDEVHRMLNNLTGQEVRWSLAEAVHRQTEGNPLFIQEVLRYLVEEGIISRQDGRYRRTGDEAPEMRIPEGLRDVIGKRLSRLGPECNRVLAVAAVIGRDFDLAILQRVAAPPPAILREQGVGGGPESGPKNPSTGLRTGLEGGPEEALISALEEAVRVGVLEERTSPGHIQYRFGHAFFRQTLYEEMLAPRRLRLHQQVARALEEAYRTRPEEHAAELAEHFAQSTDREDLEKAVAYSRMAAARAVAVYAYAEAVRLLEQAIGVQEVVDPDDRRSRCELYLALGEVLGPVGEPLRALEQAAEEAFRLAEQVGNEDLASRACSVAFDSMYRYSGVSGWHGAGGRRWADRAFRFSAPGTIERVHAELAKGNTLELDLSAGQTSGGMSPWEHYRPALEGARRLKDRHALFQCVISMMGSAPVGYLDELLKLAHEAVSLSRDGVPAYTLSAALDFCGAYLLSSGERARAEGLWREVEVLGARTRDPLVVMRPVAREIVTATIDGELQQALSAASRVVGLAEEAGSPRRGLQADIGWGTWPRLYLGRADAALERWGHVEEAWQGAVQGLLGPSRVGICLAHLGRHAEARDVLMLLAGGWQTQPPGPDANLAHLVGVLELAALVGEREVIRVVLPLVAPHAGILSTRGFHLGCPGRVLGDAAAVVGDLVASERYYRQGLEVCLKVRFRPEIALIRLGLAELLLKEPGAPRGAEALEHLEFTITEFQQMKMQPSLERALRHKGLLHA